MADIKNMLKQVVEKTAKTMELKPEAAEKMSKFSEAMKKAATTLPEKKA